MSSEFSNQLSQLPLEDLVESIAVGLADAQLAMDIKGVDAAQMLSGSYHDGEEEVDTRIDFQGEKISLLELGFQPTFYHFTATVIELKVAVEMNRDVEDSTETSNVVITKKRKGAFGGSNSTSVAAVGSRYASRFQYNAEAASLFRTRLVPVPTPDVLMDRINELLKQSEE